MHSTARVLFTSSVSLQLLVGLPLGCGDSQHSSVPASESISVSWPTPASITYGTPLGPEQLNAKANRPGSMVYDPPEGEILGAGQHELSVVFSPVGSSGGDRLSETVVLEVGRATPNITWSPQAAAVGTALAAQHLTAHPLGVDGGALAGTLTYDPPSGTVLRTPGTMTLTASFVPDDRSNYAEATAHVTIAIAGQLNPAYTWQNVKIIMGGLMPGIVMHPAERGLMYIRGNVGGAYRWDNPAQVWVPLLDALGPSEFGLSGIESIAIDPSDPNRVYIAAGSFPDQAYSSNGAIFSSGDRGKTFHRTNLPFKLGGNDIGHMAGERLAVDPSRPSRIFLGSRGRGLWQSQDSGVTWSQLASFPVTASTDKVGIGLVRFDPAQPGTVYAGAYTGGLYRSMDGGTSWDGVPNQPTTLPNGDSLHLMRIAIGPDSTVYLTYANSADLLSVNNGAVYRLDTRGAWTDITPKPTSGGALSYGFCAITSDAQRPGTVMAGTWNRWWPGDTLYRSSDSGAHWTSLRELSTRDGSAAPYIYYGTAIADFGVWIGSAEIDPFDSDHAVYPGGNTLWSTHDLTRLDFSEMTHWAVAANGIEETVVKALASPPSGAQLLSGVADLGGFRHDDFAVSPPAFSNPRMTEVRSLDFAESSPDFVVRIGLVGYEGTVAGAYSLDGGTTWTGVTIPSSEASESSSIAYEGMIAVAADGSTLVWAPEHAGAVYSTDRGASWITSGGVPMGCRVVSDRVDPSAFYGYDPSSGTLFVSQDGGRTFEPRFASLPRDVGNPGWTNQAQPRSVPGREGEVWLPLGSGLYHSTDSGTSFNRVSDVDSAAVVGFGKAAPGRDYPAVYLAGNVGGVHGIFRSDNAGDSWIRVNDDFHVFGSIAAIAGDPRIFGRVYIGSMGRGILYGDSRE